MNPEEYDNLLMQIRAARMSLNVALDRVQGKQKYLDALLEKLDQEESRIAHEVLHSTPIASRKLVIHE